MLEQLMNHNAELEAIEASLLEHIAPLLPAARLAGPYLGEMSPDLHVRFDTGHRLRVYAAPQHGRYFVFDRLFPFTEEERRFINGIVAEIHREILGGVSFSEALVSRAVKSAIARQVAPDYPATLLRVLDTYEDWLAAGQAPLSHTVGIHDMRRRSSQSNWQDNFFEPEQGRLVQSLGRRNDTLVVIDSRGGIIKVEKVPPLVAEEKLRQDILAPVAYLNIALWSNSRRKTAVRLTEEGSILVFNKKRLLFIRRNGHWHCLPHTLINLEPVPESIEGVAPETIKAVYLTAMDVSTGKTSGKSSAGGQIRVCFGKNSRPDPGQNRNARQLAVLTNARKFTEIPRAVRAEICTIGGTLFMDGTGNIMGLSLPEGENLPEAAEAETRRAYLPGRGYVELVNDNGQSNLRLNFC